jgi:hypothetical protein
MVLLLSCYPVSYLHYLTGQYFSTTKPRAQYQSFCQVHLMFVVTHSLSHSVTHSITQSLTHSITHSLYPGHRKSHSQSQKPPKCRAVARNLATCQSINLPILPAQPLTLPCLRLRYQGLWSKSDEGGGGGSPINFKPSPLLLQGSQPLHSTSCPAHHTAHHHFRPGFLYPTTYYLLPTPHLCFRSAQP